MRSNWMNLAWCGLIAALTLLGSASPAFAVASLGLPGSPVLPLIARA
jgi:hypothetical protein